MTVLENIEQKLVVLPLFQLAHIDIPDIKLPSKIDFGLGHRTFVDHCNARPKIEKLKARYTDSSKVYSGEFLQVIDDNRPTETVPTLDQEAEELI